MSNQMLVIVPYWLESAGTWVFGDEAVGHCQEPFVAGVPESLDHLIPQLKGGDDHADNLVWACRSCNSSKRDKDLLAWCRGKDSFPSLLLLRRYIKLIARYCERHSLLETPIQTALDINLPFRLDLLPFEFPALSTLSLWVPARVSAAGNSDD